jgi:hypothetical protein
VDGEVHDPYNYRVSETNLDTKPSDPPLMLALIRLILRILFAPGLAVEGQMPTVTHPL